MASTLIHRNEENKSLTQNEEPIAAGVNNQSDKPSRRSRSKKEKSKNLAATKTVANSTPKAKSKEVIISSSHATNLTSKDDKGTKKINDSDETKKGQPNVRKKKTKISAPNKKSSTDEPSSSNLGKEKAKARSSNKVITKSSTKEQPEHPLYYIKWKGFEEKTTTNCICGLCWKDIEYTPNDEDKLRNYILEEDELHSLLFPNDEDILEQMHGCVLREVAILPCRHVFHSDCLPMTLLMQHSDPPCPICLRLL